MENNIVQVNTNTNLAPLRPDKIFAILTLSGQKYALDAKCVLEIVKLTELSRPEMLPSCTVGLFEYNDKVINIIDIKSVLNIELTPYDVNSMMVIIEYKDNVFGILADSLRDLEKLDISDIQPVPYNKEHNFISSIYSNNEKQYSILDIDAIYDFAFVQNAQNQNDLKLLPQDEVSLEILRQRKGEYLEKNVQNPYTKMSDKDEFVSFFVGENKYCLNMHDIRGFYKLQDTKMIKVPCTPDFVVGLANIKGDFICVIDIKNYFHSQNVPYSGTGTIIVLNSDEFKIGILADAVSDNIQIKPEEISALTKQEGKNELMQYVREGEIYLIINIKEMLMNDKLYIR